MLCLLYFSFWCRLPPGVPEKSVRKKVELDLTVFTDWLTLHVTLFTQKEIIIQSLDFLALLTTTCLCTHFVPLPLPSEFCLLIL